MYDFHRACKPKRSTPLVKCNKECLSSQWTRSGRAPSRPHPRGEHPHQTCSLERNNKAATFLFESFLLFTGPLFRPPLLNYPQSIVGSRLLPMYYIGRGAGGSCVLVKHSFPEETGLKTRLKTHTPRPSKPPACQPTRARGLGGWQPPLRATGNYILCLASVKGD